MSNGREVATAAPSRTCHGLTAQHAAHLQPHRAARRACLGACSHSDHLHKVPAWVGAECQYTLGPEDFGASALVRFVVPQPKPKPTLDCTRVLSASRNRCDVKCANVRVARLCSAVDSPAASSTSPTWRITTARTCRAHSQQTVSKSTECACGAAPVRLVAQDSTDRSCLSEPVAECSSSTCTPTSANAVAYVRASRVCAAEWCTKIAGTAVPCSAVQCIARDTCADSTGRDSL